MHIGKCSANSYFKNSIVKKSFNKYNDNRNTVKSNSLPAEVLHNADVLYTRISRESILFFTFLSQIR